jgi:hypothetical protein
MSSSAIAQAVATGTKEDYGFEGNSDVENIL